MSKVNAGLILNTRPSGAIHDSYEIGIMTADVAAATSSERKEPSNDYCRAGMSFQAILIYGYGAYRDSRAIAARGGIRPTVDSALESLFMVTATALERYQGNVMREIAQPTDVAEGTIDTGVLRRRGKDKSWGSIF